MAISSNITERMEVDAIGFMHLPTEIREMILSHVVEKSWCSRQVCSLVCKGMRIAATRAWQRAEQNRNAIGIPAELHLMD
jgi:hypothetical protein